MPNRRIRPLHKAARCIGLVLGLLAQPGFGQGVGIEPDDQPQQQRDWGPITCVVSNDGYDVHFTAYARVSPEDGIPGEAEPPVQFCQDLPATGPTHLTLDLMNREARTQPVAVRVVREGDDDDDDPERHRSPKSHSWMSLRSSIPPGSWRPTWGWTNPESMPSWWTSIRVPATARARSGSPCGSRKREWLPTIIGPLIGVLLLAALVAAWLVYRRSGKIEI